MAKVALFYDRIKIYIRNAGVYLAASLISSLLGVLINPLIALNLSPEDYAVSTYYTSFGLLYTPVLGFFVTDFYLRKYYLLSKESLYQLKGVVIKIFLFFSGAISFLCLVGLFIFVKGTNVSFNFWPYAPLAVSTNYVGLLYSFQLAEYKISRQAKSFFWASVIWGVIGIFMLLLFVVFIKLGAQGKMIASFLGSFFPCVWCLIKNREYLHVKFDKDYFRQIVFYGYPLVLAAMLSYFTHGYDKVLLERGGDIVTLGYYSVACSMAAYITIFSNALKSTFQPDMYKAISQKSVKKAVAVGGMVVIAVAVIVSGFIVFCPWLIKVLTAGRYVQSTHMCRIVSLSVLTSTIYYQISQFTYGTGHSKLTLINKLLGTIINIIIITLLVKNYGAIGAAWSTVLGFLVYAVGNLFLLIIVRKKLFDNNGPKNTPNN